MIQERFDEMIALLRSYEESFPLVYELLNICNSSVLIFSYFQKPSASSQKQRVVESFEIRSIKRRLENDQSITAALLDQLRQTDHDHICVSIFQTGRGVFTIFTDFERTEIIGAIYSNVELKEPPLYSHLFLNGRLLSRER
ncbi:MAG: hypothetical protein JST68_14275 [Bacteroidetes bacterium]|nr:hypothetical protein [Bacteroidota bacterium]